MNNNSSDRNYSELDAEAIFEQVTAELTVDDICIDCGAHIGQQTVPMGLKGAYVFAFEPHPKCFSILQEKVRDMQNVRLYNKAVWNKDTVMRLYHGKIFMGSEIDGAQASSLLDFKKNVDLEKYTDVGVIDIVGFIRELNHFVQILKIDIEGAEVEVLNRIIDAGIYTDIGYIFCETHEKKISELWEPVELLRKKIAAEKITNIYLDWI